ncbi:MAG: zinc ribbon domain-containing protein [Ruminococcaceae bacterium]|nr:zinc ribbon domain-containing protein [Oscillospiraceae bacterium]
MFCKNCGTEIEDGAVLCPNCLASEEKTEDTSLPLETNETPKKKKAKLR